MSTLKIGIHLVSVKATKKSPNGSTRNVRVINGQNAQNLQAELLDIGPRFCRLRIPRDRYHFDPADVGIQFTWTDVVARIIWTNTTDEHVELGLLLPSEDDVPE
ncbi:MAG: hypothetical protein ACRD3E_13110 [Terriglobales bacterium]